MGAVHVMASVYMNVLTYVMTPCNDSRMNTNTAHILLIQTREGGTAAVRFPSAEAAREWDDAHPDVESVGNVPMYTRSEAARSV